LRPFIPLVRNPHLLTILGNFWPRKFDFSRWPMESNYVRTDSDTRVLVQTQRPERPRAEVTFVHGLEGAGNAGYIVSMAHACLSAGFVTHRFHMRTCGGTEHLTNTLYHAGLTSDLRTFLTQRESPRLPAFLVGFSLGGNVVLKLAGELGEAAGELISGVCAVSTPIDLGACASRIGERDNHLYERRFVKRMRDRLIATGRYTPEQFRNARSIYAIDDLLTAPSFGFGTADRYYETQSAIRFVDRIRIPGLLIQAKDDTFIPFAIFEHPALRGNPHLTVIATEYGGHLGFLQRHGRRFWIDEVVTEWIEGQLASRQAVGPPPAAAAKLEG
jgi:predicted alpha/beta-fold hydrolase